jgi:hypothetical protein
MAKKPAPWRDFEELAARIQRQLAPDSEVKQAAQIVGRSGERRTLDLSVQQKIGAYPILIAFDCKRHNRPVPMKYIEAFAAQRDDVAADAGVMISNTGFTRGAKAVARQHRIFLQTLRAAQDTDWQKLVGDKAWIALVSVRIDDVSAAALTESGQRIPVPFDVRFVDKAGQVGDVLRDLFWKAWNQTALPRPLGPIAAEITPETAAVYVQHDGVMTAVARLVVEGRCVARQWLVNLTLGGGHVLQDAQSGGPVYGELASAGFDWAEIMRSIPGAALTEDQYSEVAQRSQISVDLSKVKRFLRVMVTSDHTKGPTKRQ